MQRLLAVIPLLFALACEDAVPGGEIVEVERKSMDTSE